MSKQTLRVLHSYPHRLGRERIDTTAWHLVDGAAAAGAEVLVVAGDSVRPFETPVRVETTFTWGRLKLPYRILGTQKMCAIHDRLTARKLSRMKGKIDLVHTWPLGALETLHVAREMGIPTLLERPNAHTRFAYEAVREECKILGLEMPPGHEHAYNEAVLEREEAEYKLATGLLCPSEFVAETFVANGFPKEKLVRHQYGFDQERYSPGPVRDSTAGLRMLFVGGCAPRKGVHYALEAWLKSSAHRTGKFSIAGAFIPGYAEKLAAMLQHPSVEVLGHRKDIPELMRSHDVLILPSIEEGSALVTSEARGSGCVLLVSHAAGAICTHMHDALVHNARDVKTLTEHITLLSEDRATLERLRTASLASVGEITWAAAGRKLLQGYRETFARMDKC